MPDFLDKAMNFFHLYCFSPFLEYCHRAINDDNLANNDTAYAIAAKFIHDFLRLAPDTQDNRRRYKLPKQKVYAYYRTVCQLHSLPQPISNTQFGRTIKRCFPDLLEGRFTLSNGKQTYCYCLLEFDKQCEEYFQNPQGFSQFPFPDPGLQTFPLSSGAANAGGAANSAHHHAATGPPIEPAPLPPFQMNYYMPPVMPEPVVVQQHNQHVQHVQHQQHQNQQQHHHNQQQHNQQQQQQQQQRRYYDHDHWGAPPGPYHGN